MFRGRWRLRDEIGFNEDTFGEKVLKEVSLQRSLQEFPIWLRTQFADLEATINSKNLLAGPEGVKIQHNGTAIH